MKYASFLLIFPLFFAGCSIAPVNSTNTPEVSIYFIDVGQGLSVLVKDNSGNELLYDAGPEKSDSAVISLLDSLNVDTIETFVLSHSHEDHFGGIFNLFRQIPVKRFIWRNFYTLLDNDDNDRKIYSFINDTLNVPNVPIYINDTIADINNCKIECLWPEKTPFIGKLSAPNTNSIVLKLTVGDVSCMLNGDINFESESLIVADYCSNLKAHIITANHHGSKTSSSLSWLSAISPEIAVISCSKKNSYGHPSKEALNRFNAVGCTVHSNYKEGTIVYKTNGWAWIKE